MIYDNSKVRRQNRLLEEERAMEILRQGEYGILSMVSQDGSGYGVPLNYVYTDGRIYMHCAPEGEKLKNLAANPNVSFCVVGGTAVQPDKFSTLYESVIASGSAVLVSDDGERMEALRLILEKYSPDFYETGLKYAAASFARTAIIRIDVEIFSGKTKAKS